MMENDEITICAVNKGRTKRLQLKGEKERLDARRPKAKRELKEKKKLVCINIHEKFQSGGRWKNAINEIPNRKRSNRRASVEKRHERWLGAKVSGLSKCVQNVYTF